MKFLKSIIICLIMLLGGSSLATATPLSQTSIIHHVKSIPAGLANCTDWDNACGLQDALDKAISGDKIYVASGTYYPSSTSDRTGTFQLKSGVAIYGGFPENGGEWIERNWVSNVTAFSGDIGTAGTKADNSYHVVTSRGVDASAILDGFTISGGNALSSIGGGGMHNILSSPTLTNLSFTANDGNYGGGMLNEFSNPTLTNVTLSGNSANQGGGMFNVGVSPKLTDVTFTGNSASAGGGMANESSSPTLTNVNFIGNEGKSFGGGMLNYSSSPTLTNVTFNSNTASNSGGGMSNYDSNPSLTNVTFSDNSADDGAGVYNESSSPTLTNVSFIGNEAERCGGGMANLINSSPELTNVTFSGNSAINYGGGGMANFDGSNSKLTNVTFTGNRAGFYYFGSAIFNAGSGSILSNVIVWGNTPPENQVRIFDQTASATVTYSDIQGSYPGTGNIDSDPFLEPLADNGGFNQTHALGVGSPAIGAANPATCPATDQRGHLRLIDGSGNASTSCDIGAYEFGYSLTVDIEGSGSVAITPDKPDYFVGEIVTLTPTADPGWTFSSWSGAPISIDNKITITGNTSVTAAFIQDEYTLNVTPDGSGTVAVTPIQVTYHHGDLVTLIPFAAQDWAFTNWSGDASGTDNPLAFTIAGDTAITANFRRTLFRYYLSPIFK